jgi:hypothetical protein
MIGLVSGNCALTSRTFEFFVTDEGLKQVNGYADGIGPEKLYTVSIKMENRIGAGENFR